jgi:cytochrome c553
MNVRVSMVALALLCASATAVQAAGNADTGKTKATACAACHGADGNSMAPNFPKIAGQVPEYIHKQLQDFKAGVRVNEFMAPMVQPLSDQDMEDLAAYFAAQKATPGEGKADQLAAGETLYRKGIPGAGPKTVAACMGCHGPAGEGNAAWGKTLAAPPAVLAPALGGQYAAYIAAQLKAFAAGQRSNDVGKVMQNIANRMSDEQIAAVSEYIATLKR